jgi:tight adherence protein C
MIDFLIAPVNDLVSSHVVLALVVGMLVAMSGALAIIMHVRRRGMDIQRRIEASAGNINAAGQTPPPSQSFTRVAAAVMARVGGDQPPEHYERLRVLRFKLIQAGFLDRRGVQLFFVARVACALVLGLATFVLAMLVFGSASWVAAVLTGSVSSMLGYMSPSVYLERRIEACRNEHRQGFPDVMDLMVVCSQAGLSMEAGIQRIAAEMRAAYPSLSLHLDLATLEVRGGKPISAAVESMARRLGIEEASSFATLLHQSEELGTSLTQSLRAYSDDMRNKRMMRAEEKAYSLPAKLVVPLTLFVFPVLMIVLMLPVVVSVSRTNF